MLSLQEKSRREFFKLSAAAGVFGVSYAGWLKTLANHVAEPASSSAAKTKSCVLLWLDGGPSHKDTFDMKPDSKGKSEFKSIKTSATGIEISEHLPNLAKVMKHASLIRSMSTAEGAHPRAKYNMHTGYREGQGGLTYPSMGAIVAKEIGNPDVSLPNYVSIGNRSFGSGFLGPKYQPLIVNDPARGVEDLKPVVSTPQFEKRIGLLEEMERAFYHTYQTDNINDHKTTYARAVKMMESKESKAFDLSLESASAKTAYGTSKFAEGVLMARRLLEVGIPFVEVTLGGWDTHQDNFDRVQKLSTTLDQPAAALIADLKERGMLDSTLVIVMGEFGRTPNMNTRGAKPGRDHYPKAWTAALFGGGVKGGFVYGKTDREGAVVEEGKVSTVDFMATVCTILGIDFTKENETATKRPVRIVDKAGHPVKEIL
jgi:hypothetical protein